MKERFIYVIESETLNLCSKLWGKKKKKENNLRARPQSRSTLHRRTAQTSDVAISKKFFKKLVKFY